MKKVIVKNCIQALLFAVTFIGVWTAVYYIVGNDILLPSFFDCCKAIFVLLSSAEFWQAFLGSLQRVCIAFIFSFTLGGCFAIVSYLYPSFSKWISPVVAFLRALPTLVVLLIILVWTGAGVAPVIVAFLSLFPVLYTGIYGALLGVDKKLVEMSNVYKVPLKLQVTKMYIPCVLPQVYVSAGAGVSFAIKLVVSAEVLARTAHSLGNAVQELQIYMQTAETFALALLLCLFGAVFECLGLALSKRAQRSLQ